MEENEEELSGRPLKSLNTRIVSPVKFINHTGRRINLRWFDYEGQEVPFATLESNNRLVVNTYVTHPWIAVDEKTNERMLLNSRKIYFPNEPDIRRVDYEGRKFYAVRTQINITTPGKSLSYSCEWDYDITGIAIHRITITQIVCAQILDLPTNFILFCSYTPPPRPPPPQNAYAQELAVGIWVTITTGKWIRDTQTDGVTCCIMGLLCLYGADGK